MGHYFQDVDLFSGTMDPVVHPSPMAYRDHRSIGDLQRLPRASIGRKCGSAVHPLCRHAVLRRPVRDHADLICDLPLTGKAPVSVREAGPMHHQHDALCIGYTDQNAPLAFPDPHIDRFRFDFDEISREKE